MLPLSYDPTGSPGPPLRLLTALVSYSTSFWTELMMGAAAVGMAPADGGPTTGHQAGAQVVPAARCPLQTERGDSADPPHTRDG